jgi:UDP-N-acetyl-D-mannosaminuronic acid transferase (WecB/TagA/CpsF family)
MIPWWTAAGEVNLWTFRLAIEPQRMWRPYLPGNPVFLRRVLTETKRRAG